MIKILMTKTKKRGTPVSASKLQSFSHLPIFQGKREKYQARIKPRRDAENAEKKEEIELSASPRLRVSASPRLRVNKK